MPTSQQLFEEYQKIINQTPQLQPLNPVQNEGDIYSNLMRKADNFAPQYDELSKLETQAFATPQTEYQRFDKDYGSGIGKGLGMGSETNSMMTTIGGRYGTADAYRRGVESQRLSLADLAKTLSEQETMKRETDVYNQNLTRQNWQDKTSGVLDLYKLATDREALAEATRRAGSGGGGGLGYTGGTPQPFKSTTGVELFRVPNSNFFSDAYGNLYNSDGTPYSINDVANGGGKASGPDTTEMASLNPNNPYGLLATIQGKIQGDPELSKRYDAVTPYIKSTFEDIPSALGRGIGQVGQGLKELPQQWWNTQKQGVDTWKDIYKYATGQ